VYQEKLLKKGDFMNDDVKKILIKPTSTIKEALNIIDKGVKQIALVVNKENELLGTVTDGDIRRAILNGNDLNSEIKSVMNKDYVALPINSDLDKIENTFKNKKINQIPLVDSNNIVKDIVLINDILEKQSKDNFVVLMAGGLGTRLRPLTEDTPKPLLPVGDKPILETIIEQFNSYGFENFIITVNYKADQIRDYFGNGEKLGVNISYIEEEKRLGTAGALSLIKENINEPFFLMNADLLTKLNFDSMLNYHNDNNYALTVASREYKYEVPYGVLEVENEKVTALVEKPDHKFFVSAGVYILNPKLINKIPNNEFYDITELIDLLLDNNEDIGTFPIHEYWLDIGQHKDYKQAKDEYWSKFK
jgi:dTDP-glucose pyrophosphorylase/CBS domain-containing protein